MPIAPPYIPRGTLKTQKKDAVPRRGQTNTATKISHHLGLGRALGLGGGPAPSLGALGSLREPSFRLGFGSLVRIRTRHVKYVVFGIDSFRRLRLT